MDRLVQETKRPTCEGNGVDKILTRSILHTKALQESSYCRWERCCVSCRQLLFPFWQSSLLSTGITVLFIITIIIIEKPLSCWRFQANCLLSVERLTRSIIPWQLDLNWLTTTLLHSCSPASTNFWHQHHIKVNIICKLHIGTNFQKPFCNVSTLSSRFHTWWHHVMVQSVWSSSRWWLTPIF